MKPLKICMIGNWPAIDVLEPCSVKPRYHSRKTTHPSSWLRALATALAARDDVETVDVLIDSREVFGTRFFSDGKLRLTFMPKREPGQTDPFHAHLPARCRVSGCLRKIRPDIVHGHGTETASGWLAVKSGYVNVVTIQGIVAELRPYLQWSRLRACLFAWMELLVVKQANGLIVPSAWSMDWAGQYRQSDDLRLIPNVVSPEFLQARTDYADRTVVTIGTLTEFKNPMMIIRAFAAMNDLTARLVIIGEGYLRAACEALAIQLGVRARIVFAGRLSRPAIVDQLRHARCLAIGSRIDTAPNVVIEAHSMGLPVVGAAGGGIPDLIRHGEEGFVVPVDDVCGMAACLRKLVDDDGLAERLGTAARDRVIGENSPRTAGDRHMAWYRELIGRQQRNG